MIPLHITPITDSTLSSISWAQGETISVESENILAFTQDCDYSVRFIGVGVLSQKGLATSTLTARGRKHMLPYCQTATLLY